MAGKLSVLSPPGLLRGKDRPEPTAGKFSVLSAGSPPARLSLRGR
jgi:hypothetical protein